MPTFDHRKYRSFRSTAKANRRWPDNAIEHAPTWCSVDLRDGNQALVEPMSVTDKTRFFKLLVAAGFKEIEVGFPAASKQDYDFVRTLIDGDLIPDDVTIQALTQARESLIEQTFSALKGAKCAIVHLYNSTSTLQREQVFNLSCEAITDIAVSGARFARDCARRQPETRWRFQYSPESFTGTELSYAVTICNAVSDVWQPTVADPVIINLPATVEMSTPNVYADQIEWFCEHIERRDALIISLHTHNDRGCAVAAAELGLLAGADRVEGTLLGNGERTGNMDIITVAMNLYSQGVDPQLDLSRMDDIVSTVQDCTGLPVNPRHPYAGELVFTAFSGSHQDAINKCLSRREIDAPWDVAYLPIDPADIGRSYDALIRINSQSGKGGISFILERDHGLCLPRWLQIEFSQVIQAHVERSGSEISASDIFQLFEQTYLQRQRGWKLDSYELQRDPSGRETLQAVIADSALSLQVEHTGSGALQTFIEALGQYLPEKPVIVDYIEHTLTPGSEAKAIAYVQIGYQGQRHTGVGRSNDVLAASMEAVLSALDASARLALAGAA